MVLRRRGSRDSMRLEFQRNVGKGWLIAMSAPEVRAIASSYGDPHELLSYDWCRGLTAMGAVASIAVSRTLDR